MLELLDAMDQRVGFLEKRVGELEAQAAKTATSGLRKDEIFDKILNFMKKMPNVELTALVIGKNIHEDNGVVGSRLTTLANRGLIKSAKEAGQTRMYWYEAK